MDLNTIIETSLKNVSQRNISEMLERLPLPAVDGEVVLVYRELRYPNSVRGEIHSRFLKECWRKKIIPYELEMTYTPAADAFSAVLILEPAPRSKAVEKAVKDCLYTGGKFASFKFRWYALKSEKDAPGWSRFRKHELPKLLSYEYLIESVNLSLVPGKEEIRINEYGDHFRVDIAHMKGEKKKKINDWVEYIKKKYS